MNCLSCGAPEQTQKFCTDCGEALPLASTIDTPLPPSHISECPECGATDQTLNYCTDCGASMRSFTSAPAATLPSAADLSSNSTTSCRECNKKVEARDPFCRHCGATLQMKRQDENGNTASLDPPTSPLDEGAPIRWSKKRLVAFVLLGSLVMGGISFAAIRQSVINRREQARIEAQMEGERAEERRQQEIKDQLATAGAAIDACVTELGYVMDRMIANDSSVYFDYGTQSWEIQTARKYLGAATRTALRYGSAEAAAQLRPLLQEECRNRP